MIKKFVCAVVAVLLIFTLPGCEGYRETDACYIVTAVAFDGGENIEISLEVVSTGGGERRSDAYSEIITGQGKTPENAMFSLSSKISKILMFDHCTALVLGESVKENQLDEIINFARELKEINLSVYVVRCENARKLLALSKPSAIARGFDIVGNIRETEKDTGIKYENRFFELFAAYKTGKCYKLPFLAVDEDKIIIEGETVYHNTQKKEYLSNEDSLIYSFFINKNSGGKVYFGKEYADVVNTKFKRRGKEYTASVKVKNESDGFKKAFSNKCNEFLQKHGKKLGLEAEKAKVKIKGGV